MTGPLAALHVGGEDTELAARINRELTAFNNAATGATDEADLTVRVVDPDGELVAGLTGWTWGGRAGINTVWVRADRRHEGWGGRLLRAAEEEARRRGCTEISVASFSFQAPDFYRRHGYTDTGIRDGIPGGHVDHHFWKPLGSDPAEVRRLVAVDRGARDPVRRPGRLRRLHGRPRTGRPARRAGRRRPDDRGPRRPRRVSLTRRGAPGRW